MSATIDSASGASPTARVSPDLVSVAAPKQRRSEETLYRILDAAEALIREKGLADASIPEIVRRAGSSVGGFYARFHDKYAMLRALEERFFNELHQRVELLTDPQRWEDAPLERFLRACVEELVSTFREHKELIRAFASRANQDPDFVEDSIRFRQGVSRRISALLTNHAAEFRHPNPEVAIEIAVHLAFGLMQQLVVFGDIRVGARSLTDRELVDELTRNFMSYAGASPA